MERTEGNVTSKQENNDDDMYTPEQFKATASSGLATDEQGNRVSILPGSARPSKTRPEQSKTIASFEETKKSAPKKTGLELLREQIEQNKNANKNKPQQQRQNFVRMNTKMNYKPRSRGAAFTNKIMAKKVNSVKAKQRWAQKKKIEDLKNRD